MLQLVQDELLKMCFVDGGPTCIEGINRDTDGVLGVENMSSFQMNLAACCKQGWGQDGDSSVSFASCRGQNKNSSRSESILVDSLAELSRELEKARAVL